MLTVPLINNNGNTKESLVTEAMDIYSALMKAVKLICASDLAHGRNFQLSSVFDYTQARKEQINNLRTLENMAEDYHQLALDIHEQGKN